MENWSIKKQPNLNYTISSKKLIKKSELDYVIALMIKKGKVYVFLNRITHLLFFDGNGINMFEITNGTNLYNLFDN